MQLTIITVTFNDMQGLSETIASIAENVSYSDMDVEYIIVDGCEDLCFWSPVLKEISNHDFKYISGPDNGIFNAMNKGLRAVSNSGYVFFLNSGDCFYDQNTLSKVRDLLKTGAHDIIAGRVELIWNGLSAEASLEPWVCHQAAFVKADLLKKYEFDETFKFFGDLNLWYRLKQDEVYDPYRINQVVSKFPLGGVGNSPLYLWARHTERSRMKNDYLRHALRTLKVIGLIIIYKLFGVNTYYKVLSKVK